MISLFVEILHLSFKGSMVILVILLLRVMMIKSEKRYVYFLWIIPGMKLLFPISTFGVWNIIIRQSKVGKIFSFYSNNIRYIANKTIGGIVENRDEFMEILCVTWFLVFCMLLVKSIYQYMHLYSKLAIHKKVSHNIYLVDGIVTPCVFGIFNAKIYLPSGFNLEKYSYIVEHERIHWKRKDHVIKMIGYGIVLIHWFNPIVWLAYHYFVEDMEMSCDEVVIRKLRENERREYALSLLEFTTHANKERVLSIYFCEDSIKNE